MKFSRVIDFDKVGKYTPAILRIGIALVFLWFGADQIIDTSAWTDYIPEWVTSLSSLTAVTVVRLNAVFEIVFGCALLVGFYTRFTAFFLMLHMIDITYMVGFNSIGVRDFGLSVATVVIWLQGADLLTLDYRILKQISKNSS